MKKTLSIALIACATLFTGCAVSPTKAGIYTNATAPYMATSAKAGGKTGESEKCTNILGIVATGDCSIANAAKNGKISTVSTVDWQRTNILGIVATGKVVVTGE